MNGQQLTNSSNSANVTPSSSYPASLSSHSSRDASPSRVNNASSAQIGHKLYSDNGRPYSHNQWQPDHMKSTGNLVNNFSSQPRNPLLTGQHNNFTSTLPTLASQHSVTSNHSSSGHGDVKSVNDIRPSPQPTPPLTTSVLPSQPRNHATSPVAAPDPSTNAQIPPGHPASVNTEVSFSQFRFTQGNSNQSLTSSSQNQFPPSSISSNVSKNQLSHTSLNQNQSSPQTSQLSSKPLSTSQNQFPPSLITNQNTLPLNSQPNSHKVQSQSVNQVSFSSQNFSQKQFVQNPSTVQNPNQPRLPVPQSSLIQNPQPLPQSQRPTIPQPPITQNQFKPPLQNQHQLPVSQPSVVQNQPTFQSQFQAPVPQPPVSQASNTTNQFQPSQHLPPNPYQQWQGPNRYPQTQNMPRVQYPQQPNVIQSQPGMQQQMQPSGGDYQQSYSGPSYNNHQAAGQYQMNKRYPQMPTYGGMDGLTQNMSGMSVQSGFNKLWGMETLDLLKNRDVLPHDRNDAPPIRLQHELYEAANCSSEIFRCTLTKIPETKSLLDKSRLPLGVLIHPFKDLNQLSVIQCTVIVRCRVCRTYINPFVYFVDNKRWKCNLCFRDNELPDEFQFDPMTKTYGDPSRRPEIKSATIEFIAPSEYMVRPPQPAIYVFLLDVSRLGADCGYLEVVCRTLMEDLDNLPGDARTSVAFITYDSTVHFYALAEGMARPHQMVVVDIEEMFLPCPENLLVNLSECHELIRDLLTELPNKFRESYDTGCAMGAALQAAYKLLAPTGGRITVFQSCLPNMGPGALSVREDPSQRAGENVAHLNPVTDFYKKLALDCSNQQIAVDLFLVNSQYVDVATLSGISRFSGGCMHHFPLFRSDKLLQVQNLERVFQRYLTRKIGFESVMRLRCTRGLSIHTFHGNFFVRSTDLLSLPNANPDSGFGMQVSIDENLSDVQTVCFQAALLYTSSKGERRIRVHTLCLPVASNLSDILYGADQHCIIGLLAKMAVDRSMQSSLSDAREAFLNVAADVLSAFKLTQTMSIGTLLAPGSLRTLPLLILALLKYTAFRVGQSTRLDDRVFAMCQMKSLPLTFLIQTIYPDLYPVHNLEQYGEVSIGDQTVPQPPRLHLSSERVDMTGVYLMDDCINIMIYVGHNVHPSVCNAYFGVPHFSAIPQEMYELPELNNPESERLRSFINHLQNEKPYPVPIQVIREDSPYRLRVIERLVEDKNEAGPSYYEFLQRIKALVK